MTDAAKEFRKKQKSKLQSREKRFETIGLVAAGILAVLILTLILGLFFGPGPKAVKGKRTEFYVAAGNGAGKIADDLKKQNLLRSPTAFRILSIVTGSGRKIKSGEYEIPSGASPLKIIKILTLGDVINHKLTIPEGLAVAQVYEKIKNNPMLSGDLPPMPGEGTLSPDTYPLIRGDTRKALLDKMVAAQAKILDELWLQRSADLPIKTKEEALVLASIVEKETGIAEERPQVAAVFVNRLREGMKLQSDPTIIYGITKGFPLGRKILKDEITKDTPWNTYVINGLPPTPICNPGKDAIKAVLNPPKTKDLFFVADGTGGHVFAETYEEHERNVAKWREIRAQKEKLEQNAPKELEGGK